MSFCARPSSAGRFAFWGRVMLVGLIAFVIVFGALVVAMMCDGR